MKTFYTIIKIAPNTLAGDALSIGLLLHNGDKYWLQFSEERKSVAKKLLDSKAEIVDFVVKQLKDKVAEMNNSLAAAAVSLFSAEGILNAEKLQHISNYSNGVVRFSEPAFLNDQINDGKFQQLFSLLIDKQQVKIKQVTDDQDLMFKEKIRVNLIEKVEGKVHTNLELTPENLVGLYCNFNIDCIGLNGAFIAAKAIPFHKKYETIDKELSHYMAVISILKLSYKRNNTDDHFYIIADEPTEISSKEHRTWESLKSNPAIKMIFSEEVATIAGEIEEKGAGIFL